MVNREYNYSNVIDLGNRASPGDRIDGILGNLASNNTLIKVPDEEYRCATARFGGVTDFGIVAKDGANPVFRAPGGLGGKWFDFDGGRVQLEGIEFDSNGNPAATINLQCNGPFVARDITRRGKAMTGVFRPAVNSGNKGLIQNCRAPDGGVDGERARFTFVPTGNNGHIHVDGCFAQYMTDNGNYASPSNGPVTYTNNLFKNNNISNIRVGMPATVRNNIVIIDDTTGPFYKSRKMRGIWLRNRGGGNIVVENCDVTQTGDWHPIAIEGGSGEIRNCRVENNNTSAIINRTANYTGSGIHLTGNGDLTGMPNSWVACKGAGCDEPRTSFDDDGGGGNGGGGVPEGTWVSITGTEGSPCDYELVADGEWVAKDKFNSADSISADGTTWTGRVFSGTDMAKYQGCIKSFSFDGPSPTVTVGGEQVNLSEVANCDTNGGGDNGGGQEPSPGEGDRALAALLIEVSALAAQRLRNQN